MQQRMSRVERAEALKSIGVPWSWIPVLAVAAPLINVYFRDDLVWTSLVLMVGPMILLVRGVRALVYPADSAAMPRAVVYGAASTFLLLGLAPVSIKVAAENVTLHPSWLVLSISGAAASAAYLWFAYRYWQNRRRVT